MSPFNQFPGHFRNLNSPRQLLKQPGFWAISAALVVLGLSAWEYWKNPGWFNSLASNQGAVSEQPTVKPTLSSETPPATSANLNSSSGSLKEFNPTSTLPRDTLPSLNYQAPKTQGLLTPLPSLQTGTSFRPAQSSLSLGTSQPRLNTSNPLAASPQKFVNTRSLSASSRFTNIPSFSRDSSSLTPGGTTNSALSFNSLKSPNNPGALPTTPLPNALNRVAGPTSTTANEARMPANAQNQSLPTSTSARRLPAMPGTVPVLTGYNPAAGQLPTEPAAVPGVTGDNPATGQLSAVPATVPGVTGNPSLTTPSSLLNPDTLIAPSPSVVPSPSLAPSPSATGVQAAAPAVPVAPVKLSKFGQYSNQLPGQTNGVTNPGFDSMLENPGLQPTQANLPTFTAPPAVPGSEVWGVVNTLSKQE